MEQLDANRSNPQTRRRKKYFKAPDFHPVYMLQNTPPSSKFNFFSSKQLSFGTCIN